MTPSSHKVVCVNITKKEKLNLQNITQYCYMHTPSLIDVQRSTYTIFPSREEDKEREENQNEEAQHNNTGAKEFFEIFFSLFQMRRMQRTSSHAIVCLEGYTPFQRNTFLSQHLNTLSPFSLLFFLKYQMNNFADGGYSATFPPMFCVLFCLFLCSNVVFSKRN